MKYIYDKERYDYLVNEIFKCGKILKENSTIGKEVSWKVFWIRVDAHKRRLSAMRELDRIKEERYKFKKKWI